MITKAYYKIDHCPKCIGIEFTHQWHPYREGFKLMTATFPAIEEHMVWTCTACGWSYQTKCKDKS
jgi:hypothetical protein